MSPGSLLKLVSWSCRGVWIGDISRTWSGSFLYFLKDKKLTKIDKAQSKKQPWIEVQKDNFLLMEVSISQWFVSSSFLFYGVKFSVLLFLQVVDFMYVCMFVCMYVFIFSSNIATIQCYIDFSDSTILCITQCSLR